MNLLQDHISSVRSSSQKLPKDFFEGAESEEDFFLEKIEKENDEIKRRQLLIYFQKNFLRPVGRYAEASAILENISRHSRDFSKSEIVFLELEKAEILLESSVHFDRAKNKFEELKKVASEIGGEEGWLLEFRARLGVASSESRIGNKTSALHEQSRVALMIGLEKEIDGLELLNLSIAMVQIYLNNGEFDVASQLAEMFLQQLDEAEENFRGRDEGEWGKFLITLFGEQKLNFLFQKNKLLEARAIAKAKLGDESFAEEFLISENSSASRARVLAAVDRFDEALEIFQEEGLSFEAAEIFLKKMALEFSAGEKMSPSQKEKFFKSVTVAEDSLGIPLFKFFGFGGGAAARPNSLIEARSIIEKIYPKNSPRESLQAFYRDTARFRSRRFKKTVGDFFEKENGERLTRDELLEVGEREFGFKKIRCFPNSESFEFFSELKEEIIFYAREKNWPEESFSEILERIREEDKIVAFKNFFEGRGVVERALLVPSESDFFFIEYDSKKNEIFSCEQQIGIRNLFDNFLGREILSSEESFLRILEKAENESCRFDDEMIGRILEKKATEIFFETIGAEIISKGGDFVFLRQFEFIDFCREKIIEPFSISIVTSLRDSQPGMTLMEKYAGCSAENLFSDHAKNLSFLKNGEKTVDRGEIGSTGSFAISREFRGWELSSSRLFGEISRFLVSSGHRFVLLIMGFHARALLEKLEIPFYPFLSLNEEILDRSGHSEEKQKEWKSYTDNAKILTVELSEVVKICSN